MRAPCCFAPETPNSVLITRVENPRILEDHKPMEL